MRAKNSKTTNGNPELIEALEAIAREKDISKEVLLEAIQNSLLAACKDQFGKSDNIRVVLDETTGEFHVYQDKVVVEEVLDDTLEIALAEAEARHGVTDLGATVSIEVTPKNFGRISAQKAKQVVVQKIREEERKVLYDQYYTKEKDIITGTVQRYSNGNYTVNIGKIDTVLTEQEQVKTERFRSHEKIRVYVTEVKDTPRGPRIVISRTHPELVKRLFEAEVAEIQSGVVEIKSVSREAGSRSKIAVYSRNPDVDAVGACVGMNGARVNAVVNELRGEKIDIVEWNENNYDVNSNEYMKAAYKEKKWAFVSDYARIDVVYKYGGIYMDTDVELVKELDSFLNDRMYCGWEMRDPLLDKLGRSYENSVAFGLGFGAEKGHPALKKILDLYDRISFYNEDGTLNLMACPHYQTEILKEYGLDDTRRTYQHLDAGIVVYEEEVFSPKSPLTGKTTITNKTVSIHQFSMTWINAKERKLQNIEWNLTERFGYGFAHTVTKIISLPYRVEKKITKIVKKSQ